jgi:hypothetical protein
MNTKHHDFYSTLHKFLYAKVLLEDYDKKVPLLVEMIEAHFNRLHVMDGQVNRYNFGAYINNFAVYDDFKYELRVEIDDFYTDKPVQHPSAREIVIEHFLQRETAERAHKLSNLFFKILVDHACDYAVTVTRFNMLYQVFVVTGVDTALALIEEKKADFDHRENSRQFIVAQHTCERVGDIEYSLDQLGELWERLSAVPVYEDGRLETHFLHFPASTALEGVLAWFERERGDFRVEKNGKLVEMYELRRETKKG